MNHSHQETPGLTILRAIFFIPAAVAAYTIAKLFIFLCAWISIPKILPVIQNNVDGFGGYYINGPWAVIFSEGIAAYLGTLVLYTVTPRSKGLFLILNGLIAAFVLYCGLNYIIAFNNDVMSTGAFVKDLLRLVIISGVLGFFGIAHWIGMRTEKAHQ